MRQENVNSYDQKSFKEQFINTELCKKIKATTDIMVWHKCFVDWQINSRDCTIRKKARSRIASMPTFYYLQYLLEKNPQMIIDLGCGDNFFKQYIPQIYGIDALPATNKWFEADAHQLINDYWLASKKNKYESLMTICAMHFRPIEEVREIITLLINMIKPGGRGYIAFNATRLLEQCNIEKFQWLNSQNRTKPTHESGPVYSNLVSEVDNYIREALYDLPANILVFDLDLTWLEDALDGNLRIVFERC